MVETKYGIRTWGARWVLEPKYLNGRSVAGIAHMGHINPVMILGLLSSIEAGLAACNIPHSTGGATAAGKLIAENTY